MQFLGGCNHWMPVHKKKCGKPAITPMNYKDPLCRFHLRTRKAEVVAEFIRIERILKVDAEKIHR